MLSIFFVLHSEKALVNRLEKEEVALAIQKSLAP